MTTGKWLIAGLGNPLLGPDGFGPAVIRHLRQHPSLPSGTVLEESQPDLLACFDRFGTFHGVVVVDAVLGRGRREVTVVGEDTFTAWSAASPDAHTVSPLLAVKLYRALHPRERTRFVLVGLVVDRIDSASRVSSGEVEAAVEAVLRIIRSDAPR
jgi:hydrogenase maturation protease